MKTPLIALIVAAGCGLICAQDSPKLQAQEKSVPGTWFRGNTHTHSLWSDGNDFPEMIVGWYADNGYDFIALSDHNILAVSEKWMTHDAIAKRQRAIGRSAMQKYEAKYGKEPGWIETRKKGESTEVRLKRIDEYRTLFEKPGEFLVLQAEEISNTSADGKPIHVNAINLPGKNTIVATKKEAGLSATEIIRQNAQAAVEREEATGASIITHLNHPNFQWALTAADLAKAVEESFFEVYNGHPGINHLGDAERPGDEVIWDIANTMRIAELDAAPLFGVATDDSHTYHGGDVSPGRGWVMVSAEKLEGNALMDAMKRGDFYSSTGVNIDHVNYDPRVRTAAIRVKAEAGETFTIEWIGTRKGYDPAAADGKTGIGEIFETTTTKGDETLFYKLPEDALYARATITSSKQHSNPSFENQKQQAWTQPMGWKK